MSTLYHINIRSLLLKALMSPAESLSLLVLLIQNGANIEAQTANGLTALHSAVILGAQKIVRMLLEYGASTNVAMVSNGRTPLLSVIHRKNRVIAGLLIKHGAKIDAKDKHD